MMTNKNKNLRGRRPSFRKVIFPEKAFQYYMDEGSVNGAHKKYNSVVEENQRVSISYFKIIFRKYVLEKKYEAKEQLNKFFTSTGQITDLYTNDDWEYYMAHCLMSIVLYSMGTSYNKAKERGGLYERILEVGDFYGFDKVFIDKFFGKDSNFSNKEGNL